MIISHGVNSFSADRFGDPAGTFNKKIDGGAQQSVLQREQFKLLAVFFR